MNSHTLVLSPDMIPADEFATLDMFKGVQCLIIEQGPESGYRTSLPGRLKIPGEILIRPGAILEVNGDLKAGRIYGEERAAIFVSGELQTRSIHVNPMKGVDARKAPPVIQAGIVVGGYLYCEEDVCSQGGSIVARAIRAKGDIEAGGYVKVVEDIHATNIRTGGEVVAGGIIYVPGGNVNAGGRITAQLLHGNTFYPGLPVDLATSVKDKDRQVVGNITGGEVVAGLHMPHPRPNLVPRYRLPDEMKAVLDQRMLSPAAASTTEIEFCT